MVHEAVSSPADLAELQRSIGSRPTWLANLVQPEVGGGRAKFAHLRQLDETPEASALRISGLDQPTFERLVSDYGARFLAIHFWKCPRIVDLSPLEDLPELELVAYYWNQQATKFWNFSRTPRLRGLCFEDFTRIAVLDELASATSVRELVFGNVVARKSSYASLDPLAGLTGLERLQFTPLKILDDRVEAIGLLTKLELLTCPTNLFTSRQFAWLRARLPHARTSRVLQPILKLGQPIGDNDVLLVGRGKPLLNSTTAQGRIDKHVAQFERDVELFLASPEMSPD